MKRKEARALAFELMYEFGFHQDEDIEAFYETSLRCRESKGDAYAKRLFFGAVEHQSAIDKLISAHSAHWSIDRMSRVSASILRVAIYEMCFDSQVGTPVAINEAVELSKYYEGEDAFVFINGVLGGIARSEEGVRVPRD